MTLSNEHFEETRSAVDSLERKISQAQSVATIYQSACDSTNPSVLPSPSMVQNSYDRLARYQAEDEDWLKAMATARDRTSGLPALSHPPEEIGRSL